jgi:N-methylhydantoinase A
VAWAGNLAATEAAFAQAHNALYGFTLETGCAADHHPVGCDRWTVCARPFAIAGWVSGGANRTDSDALRGGYATGSLYDRARMGAGDWCDGPAIVTQLDATTLAPPGRSGTMHESGVLVLQRRSQPGGE